nr:tetratricopeptide repeat protein [uncultured Desulfobulbus sp.]
MNHTYYRINRPSTKISLFAITFILIFLNISNCACRQLIRDGEIYSEVSDSFTCDDEIYLSIISTNKDSFRKGNASFQRLIGKSRAILNFECSTFKLINISGYHNGEMVYSGTSRESENWEIIGRKISNEPHSHNTNYASLDNLFNKGNQLYKNKKYAKSFPWFKDAATQGHAKSQYKLGVLYYYGRGVSVNYPKALQWIRKSAAQGNAEAENHLGVLYNIGKTVPKDYKLAAKWYRKAADQGDADAQNNLGTLYQFGQGVPKNMQKAKDLYEKAMAQGHEKATAKWWALQPDYHTKKPTRSNSLASNDSSSLIETQSKEQYLFILKNIHDGNFKAINKDSTYKNFFVAYIAAYSDWCGSNIKSGITRTREEWEEDQYGFEHGTRSKTSITIETPYIKPYDTYTYEIKSAQYKKMASNLGQFLNAKNWINAAPKIFNSFAECRLVLNNHLNQGCKSNNVRTTYRNLLKFDKK